MKKIVCIFISLSLVLLIACSSNESKDIKNDFKVAVEVELEALVHDYKIYDEVAPKAEEAGTKEHVKCERCGDIYLSYNQKALENYHPNYYYN